LDDMDEPNQKSYISGFRSVSSFSMSESDKFVGIDESAEDPEASVLVVMLLGRCLPGTDGNKSLALRLR